MFKGKMKCYQIYSSMVFYFFYFDKQLSVLLFIINKYLVDYFPYDQNFLNTDEKF